MLSIFRNNKGEVSTLVVLGLFAVIAAATFITTTLNQDRRTTNTRAGNDTTVSASSCPYDSGSSIPLGQTESNASNMENRWPISQHPHEYDILGPGYFVLQPNTDESILNLTKTDGGAVDSKMNNFMGSMFGFKPKKLAAAYNVAYGGSVPRGNDTQIKGDAPVLEVAVDPSDPTVRVPATGYDIGGGYEAMVVFAAEDRVTLHIGRHEYFVGSGGNNCNGNTCSGGYWIYVKGICVDQKILQAYRSVEAAQKAAGADKNPIQLPMLMPGHILGKATTGKVLVGVRDNGPFISTFKSVYWGGVPEKDTLSMSASSGGTTSGGNTGASGNTNTPIPSSPPATCGNRGQVCCNTAEPDPVGSIGAACVSGNVCIKGLCVEPPTPTPPQGITCGYPGMDCCSQSNTDSQVVGAACVSGSSCVNRICVANPTATPTTAPTQSQQQNTTNTQPQNVNREPTATQQQCNNVNITGAVYKHDASGKITFFRVLMNPEESFFGPKVALASDFNDKIPNSHIIGPTYGNIQWEDDQFPDITITENQYKNFYLEVEANRSQNMICANLVVRCSRPAGSQADTEITCNASTSQNASNTTTLTVTEDVNAAGRIGTTAEGQTAIIIDGSQQGI